MFVIDVYADWCPTCRVQSSVIEEYVKERSNLDIVFLKVNYDEQKDWVKHFNAHRQSTLVGFKGKNQVFYSVAETGEVSLVLDG